jgi:hypothetical protein
MKTKPVESASVETDRRQSQRKRFLGKIEIEWGSAMLAGTVRDIGPQGLFVEIEPPLWVGARFMARLIVSPVLVLDCVVRRVEPGAGIAVTFDISDDCGRSHLESLLATLPPV